jgi:small subunit ribosomal protein S18
MAAGKKRAKSSGEETRAPSAGKRRRTDTRRKSCFFCKDKVQQLDYKNLTQLGRYVSDRGKIRGRGQTGVCRRHQAQVATAIKRAREMALLPYVSDEAERSPRSRSRSDR